MVIASQLHPVFSIMIPHPNVKCVGYKSAEIFTHFTSIFMNPNLGNSILLSMLLNQC
jgi:hypothetical protein